MTIGFWKSKREGFAVTHSKGLTEEQIKIFQTLRPGDYLGLWVNTIKVSEHSPDFTLKVMKYE